jgi:hypothetical protein
MHPSKITGNCRDGDVPELLFWKMAVVEVRGSEESTVTYNVDPFVAQVASTEIVVG